MKCPELARQDITLCRRTFDVCARIDVRPLLLSFSASAPRAYAATAETRASDTGLKSPHSAPKTYVCVTSARPSTTDSCRTSRHFREGPQGDICSAAKHCWTALRSWPACHRAYIPLVMPLLTKSHAEWITSSRDKTATLIGPATVSVSLIAIFRRSSVRLTSARAILARS
jgi:hypothetical protein